MVGHWSRKRWGIPPRTRCWEPPQDNESSPKFSATLDQRCNRLHYIITATWYIYANDKAIEDPPRRLSNSSKWSFSAAKLGV